ncbi:hypothetical protein L210DRAFT_2912752 [Boletus edulis BED1]|uniref:Uncharacterized protein n=1 Tax=Boletus edulis BED1 TaxID=1328754 RepID=A0AAD4GA50_BOLED|nr:hypothetical protein L210DRAFT_2912752 [Boletus edulis BED1]
MVSSARNPNESYADRAKKASTPRTTQQNVQQPATYAHSTHPPSSLRPPQVNVWAERIKEQQAHVVPQPPHMPRQRATSSSQPSRDDAIQPRSPPPSHLSAQLAILDQQDDHDPFVVRVPSHLSRRSSSSTNPLPATDPNAWPLPGTAPHSNTSGHESPFVSAPPSRQTPLLFGTMLTPHPAPCASLAYKVSLSTLVLNLNQELRVDPVALPPVHVCRSVAAHCLYKTILFRKISD